MSEQHNHQSAEMLQDMTSVVKNLTELSEPSESFELQKQEMMS